MWHGQVNEPKIEDTGSHIQIWWDVKYELLGEFLRFDPTDSTLRSQAVGSYPMDAIRSATFKLESFEKRHLSVISQDDAEDQSPEIIAQLVRKGWPEDDLHMCAGQGFRYSPSRNSLLSPLDFSENL